jgi:hypothetical protein
MKHYINPTTKEIFAYELDGSQDHLISSELIPVNDSDLAALREEQQATAFAALSYAQKRSIEYPSITDQLDALFHAGLFPAEMAAKIQAVKDKYPKN